MLYYLISSYIILSYNILYYIILYHIISYFIRYTGLITQTVRLSQYAGNLVFRIILEVLVTIFSLFYIRPSFITRNNITHSINTQKTTNNQPKPPAHQQTRHQAVVHRHVPGGQGGHCAGQPIPRQQGSYIYIYIYIYIHNAYIHICTYI